MKNTIVILMLFTIGSAHAADYFIVNSSLRASDVGSYKASVTIQGRQLQEATVGMPYVEDISSAASVVDKYNRSKLSFSGGAHGLDVLTTGVIEGFISEPGSFIVPVTASYGSAHESADFAINATYASSCLDLLQRFPGTPSGWYSLDVDGSGMVQPHSYYCDMTSEGGGWTRVVRQTENENIAGWTGGVTGASYVLTQAQIPAHTQTGFSRDDVATGMDYFNYQYSTGNIPLTVIVGLKTNKYYHIHRNTLEYYDWHNPEESLTKMTNGWHNTLTVDSVNGRNFTWAYSPMNADAYGRGYSYNGADLQGLVNTQAWTVWVR